MAKRINATLFLATGLIQDLLIKINVTIFNLFKPFGVKICFSW